MEKTWEVYRLLCLTTGRGYIGITVEGHSRRWRRHMADAAKATRPSAIQGAIKKYGASDFVVLPLYTAVDRREAIAIERGLIASYGTLWPLGYNLTSGGETTAGSRWSPEQRLRVSMAKRGRKQTLAHIEARRLGMIGHSVSEQGRANMRAAALRTGRRPPNSPEIRAKIIATKFAKVTHCPHGHEYNQENTYIRKRLVRDGIIRFERMCRICGSERSKARQCR